MYNGIVVRKMITSSTVARMNNCRKQRKHEILHLLNTNPLHHRYGRKEKAGSYTVPRRIQYHHHIGGAIPITIDDIYNCNVRNGGKSDHCYCKIGESKDSTHADSKSGDNPVMSKSKTKEEESHRTKYVQRSEPKQPKLWFKHPFASAA